MMSEPTGTTQPTSSETPPPATTETTPPATTEPPKVEPPKPGDQVVPLTIDMFKAPDGVEFDKPMVEEALGYMNDQSLTPKDRMEKLIGLQMKIMNAASEKSSKSWSDTQEEWTNKAKTEFGENLEPALGGISKLIDKFAPTPEAAKELRDVFTFTGAGNHPAVLRFLHNIAKTTTTEGALVSGNPVSRPRDAASILYPNQGAKT